MDFDPNKNYYDILGVSEDATESDIKKAFRKAAVKHHPDKWWNKEEFQKVNEAHQILSDSKKKQQYDSFRKWWFGWWWGHWWFGWFWGWDFWWFWGVDLWDIVWSVFGGGFGWGSWKPKRGDDLQKNLTITFEESFLWAKKKIKYTRKVVVEWAEKKNCPECNWLGRVSRQAQTPFGIIQTQVACPICGWLWATYTKNGKDLPNWGLETKTEIMEVNIPIWIKDDVYLKYSNKWDDWISGTPTWDLYIKIRVSDSDKYIRKWEDLYVKINITIFDMVLWWEYKVPHPEGAISVKIPKWIQIWDKIRVASKGFWKWWIFWTKWDMYVTTKTSIPKKLTKKEEKLWKDLRWDK